MACSEMEDSALHFEGDLVEKKDNAMIIMLDIGPSERMKRECVIQCYESS